MGGFDSHILHFVSPARLEQANERSKRPGFPLAYGEI